MEMREVQVVMNLCMVMYICMVMMMMMMMVVVAGGAGGVQR